MLKRFGRVLTAVAVVASLAACSPSGPVAGNEEKSSEWVRSEFIKMETQGGAMGETLSNEMLDDMKYRTKGLAEKALAATQRLG